MLTTTKFERGAAMKKEKTVENGIDISIMPIATGTIEALQKGVSAPRPAPIIEPKTGF